MSETKATPYIPATAPRKDIPSRQTPQPSTPTPIIVKPTKYKGSNPKKLK